MSEDFGWSGDEFLIGGCREDWGLDADLPGEVEDEDESWEEDDCPLDGDAESALASAGMGTDEDYGSYGGDEY